MAESPKPKMEAFIINAEIVVHAIRREDATHIIHKILMRHPSVKHVEILKERPR